MSYEHHYGLTELETCYVAKKYQSGLIVSYDFIPKPGKTMNVGTVQRQAERDTGMTLRLMNVILSPHYTNRAVFEREG